MPFNLRGPELIILLFLVAVVVGVVLLIRWVVKSASSSATPQQQSTPGAPQPAGWYPVPDGSGRVAWWDGEKWADQQPPSS